MEEEKFIDYVKYRLFQWAKWFADSYGYGLGFPSATVEYRMMVEGVLTKREGAKSLPFNEEAEEIELLIVEMSKQNQLMAFALRKQYCKQLKSRERSKQMGMCYMKFKKHVDMAHQWLAGRLSAPRKK